ncbi:hypothetical protein PoB_000055800 [Plakobranchus ocellatus]|uniref:Uncharacterized protein n=1 Tax=Plakobranchus ocellatus TaxID=259542 RepID=A0AAV3XUV9_9GAST|nr:hypothetical protein PoB_000055800 [Plakobranchus ocellatus]
MAGFVFFVYSLLTTGDSRLSYPPSGQGAGGGARTGDRRDLVDVRADHKEMELRKRPHRILSSTSLAIVLLLLFRVTFQPPCCKPSPTAAKKSEITKQRNNPALRANKIMLLSSIIRRYT